MRKKILSLALALAMCLGLTIPAFAAEPKVGDTTVTVTDSTGFNHILKLSNPILSVDTIDFQDGTTVYQIPEGTSIIPVMPSGAKDTSKSFGHLNYRLTDDRNVSYFCGHIFLGYGPDDDPDGPPQWKVYPGGEEGESFKNGEPLDVGIWNIVCRTSWMVLIGNGNAAGTDSASETICFQVIKADSPATQPQQPAAETIASPTNDKLEVNGNAADPTVYKIGGSNYFKIRDVAALLNGTEKQFSVGYDGEKNAVTATTGQGYDKQSSDLAGAAKDGDQSAAASNDAIYVNGEKITAEVYKIDGSNYFKLRDLGKALDFYVGWTAERGMYIETDKPYSE